jgi:hypothetical protein
LAPSSINDAERLDTAPSPLVKEEAAPPEMPASGERPAVPATAIDPFEEELPFAD